MDELPNCPRPPHPIIASQSPGLMPAALMPLKAVKNTISPRIYTARDAIVLSNIPVIPAQFNRAAKLASMPFGNVKAVR